MKAPLIIAIAVAAIAIGFFLFARRSGYRGAIGFKNRCPLEIAKVELMGFSRPLECQSLASGEHSFNYLGRQDLPQVVQLRWQLVSNAGEQTAQVSLTDVPKDLKDGEIFFILRPDGTWTVELATELQLEELQRGE